MRNPCSCMRPQKAVMVFAVVDAVLSLIGLGLLILGLVVVLKYNDDNDIFDDDYYEGSARTIAIVVAIIGAVITLLQVILAFTLYSGAKNVKFILSNSYRTVRVWYMITLVIFVINCINLIMNVVGGIRGGTSFAGIAVNFVYKIYELWVVQYFMQVLQREQLGLGGNTFMPTAYPQTQTTTIYATPNTQQAYPMQSYPGAPPAYQPSFTAPYPGTQEPQLGFTYTQPTTVRNELYTGPQPQPSTFGTS